MRIRERRCCYPPYCATGNCPAYPSQEKVTSPSSSSLILIFLLSLHTYHTTHPLFRSLVATTPNLPPALGTADKVWSSSPLSFCHLSIFFSYLFFFFPKHSDHLFIQLKPYITCSVVSKVTTMSKYVENKGRGSRREGWVELG